MRPAAPADRVFPEAREEGLVIEELEDELLIYDLETDRAHCLNATAALVWRHCDGKRSVAWLAALLSDDGPAAGSEEVVWDALEQLNGQSLLAEPVLRPPRSRDWSRREILVRVGGASAAVGAAALVTSIVAPIPEAAASHQCGTCPAGTVCCPHAGTCAPNSSSCLLPAGATCSQDSQCCSGDCLPSNKCKAC